MRYGLALKRRAAARLRPAVLAMALASATLGCGGPSHLASTINMGDAQAAAQLSSGFYGVEQNSWRWTRREFSVTLGAPAGAAQKGAVLRARVTAPPPLIDKLADITLSAKVNGQQLAPETYNAAGTYVFTRDVPAGLLAVSPVKVDFQLDKVMPPAGEDLRELGIVVLSIGLESK
jgi:hypothetical protein